METTLRKCPHCGEMIDVTEPTCPACEWKLNWTSETDNKYVEYLQAPFSGSLVALCFAMAVIGQLMLFLSCDFFDGLLPYRGELLIGGHLMKGFGEATMLYCMLYGLRFEQRPLTAHVLVAMLLALAYHLSTTGLLVMQSELTVQTNTQWYEFCAYLLIISETVMAVLGFRLTITYNGQLSVMGIVMTGAMLLHLGFNLLLQWSGHDVYVDGGVALVTIAYFWLLERMLLDHEMYMRVIAHGLIDEKL